MNRWSPCAALLSLCFLTGCSTTAPDTSAVAQQCFDAHQQRFSEVLACYRAAQAKEPLHYVAGETTQLPGVEKRSFALTSQHWSPHQLVTPADWQHEVTIYIPADALPGKALLVANNGTNSVNISGSGPQVPSDFTEAMALTVARQTRTIVIAVSNIPNQYLHYADDGVARAKTAAWRTAGHCFASTGDPAIHALARADDGSDCKNHGSGATGIAALAYPQLYCRRRFQACLGQLAGDTGRYPY